MIRFHCPNCESLMEVDESFSGRPARCPTCGCELRIPRAEDSVTTPLALGAEEPAPSGPTSLRLGDETVEIVPPVDTMAIASVALLVASVAAGLLIGLTTSNRYAWIAGTGIGALLSLLAAMLGLPACYNIRRSRGRKRGRALAMVGMLGGLVILVGFIVGVIVSVSLEMLRPSCEENLARINQALRAYAARHEGRLPRNLETLAREGFLSSASWLTCPASAAPRGTPTYKMVPGINLNRSLFPRDMMVVSDGENYEHKDARVRVLLLDGSIKKIPNDQWKAYQKQQAALWAEVQRKIRAGAARSTPSGAESRPTEKPERRP